MTQNILIRYLEEFRNIWHGNSKQGKALLLA
jgi:hypothetical protein